MYRKHKKISVLVAAGLVWSLIGLSPASSRDICLEYANDCQAVANNAQNIDSISTACSIWRPDNVRDVCNEIVKKCDRAANVDNFRTCVKAACSAEAVCNEKLKGI